MKIFTTAKGLWFLLFSTRIFWPQRFFKGKRIAIIGGADSAFQECNGDFIDNFDIIVRINKAPHSWSPEKAKYIGSRTDILFHSFYENTNSGGGPIDFNLYEQQGIKCVVNPNCSLKGLQTHLNYFKRNFYKQTTYILPYTNYKEATSGLGDFTPTVGYSALYSILNSEFKEVFITGFTFFQTPYGPDYRDHLQDLESINKHIEEQGMHDPVLELKQFIIQLEKAKKQGKISLDSALADIVDHQKREYYE